MIRSFWRALAIFTLQLFILISSYGASPGVVVLVPGMGSSFFPSVPGAPYYSPDIVRCFKSRGFDVLSLGSLNSSATFEENGALAEKEIRIWYTKKYPNRDAPLFLVGHSSGGFYALSALHRLNGFPIKGILFVSTPLSGSPVADQLLHLAREKGGLYRHFEKWKALKELSRENVERFFEKLPPLQTPLHLASIGGIQHHDGFSFPSSLLLSNTGRYLHQEHGHENDGLVGIQSALSPSPLNISPLSELILHLDHFEQVIDWRYFLAFSPKRARFVRNEQFRVYSALADHLKAL